MGNDEISRRLKQITIALWAIFIAVVSGFAGLISLVKNGILNALGLLLRVEPLQMTVIGAIVLAALCVAIAWGGWSRIVWLKIEELESRSPASRWRRAVPDVYRLLLAFSIIAVPIAFLFFAQLLWNAFFPSF